MDEEITIINTKTRNEKIKSFFIENKKLLISTIIAFILILLSFYSYQIYKDHQKKLLSDKYNKAIIEFKDSNKSKVILSMKEIINDRDSTYSPLALYFLIDQNLIKNNKETNDLFDILINKTSLDEEIKNLIIYKKALYNAELSNENELLKILNPLINSKSVWKSHALYLVAEYFYSKNEKKKSKEFFKKILDTKNANQNLVKEAQKRLVRDLSD
jgi:predicted negative regulator of RcsB-dependent stress response